MSKKEKLRCILVKVFEQPKVIEIEHNLSTLQNYVGGLIDIVEIEEDVVIIINDEGKLLGLSPNLVLYEFRDIIVGDFLVVGQKNGETISLSEEKIEKYMKRFDLKRRLLWEMMI